MFEAAWKRCVLWPEVFISPREEISVAFIGYFDPLNTTLYENVSILGCLEPVTA